MPAEKKAGSPAAMALVVANMVGTGVFVSLGYQLADFHSAPPIIALWILGGIVALCGALCYAELAERLPRSGGEYHFLGSVLHPSLGLMAGILSVVVGFGAPTAITAMALGKYLQQAIPAIDARVVAAGVILLGATAHGWSAKTSGRVQVVSTGLKLLLIGAFLVAAAVLPGRGDIRWQVVTDEDLSQILHPAFAGAAFYVFYSYTGWNAAVYGLEEWHQPRRTVRRALIGGTLLVTVLYVALNSAFLKAAPMAELRGREDVGHVAAVALFGESTGRLISGLFAAGLFASVSALLWAGPRVLWAMSRDLPALRVFSSSGKEAPLRPLIFQSVLALVLVAVGEIEWLLTYTQTGLTLCSFLTVVSLLAVVRRVDDRIPPRVLVPAVVFLAVTGFVMVRLFWDGRSPALIGLATAVCCALLWFPFQRGRK